MKALNGSVDSMSWTAVRILKLTVKSWASVTWSEHSDVINGPPKHYSFDRVFPDAIGL
jgi:hypothetical protein